jgi:DNA-binding LacI/PurR family transcriptional regulator
MNNEDTSASPKRQRVTITEVAKMLGVAVSTVSNAYNRPDQLSAALREQVLETAAKLGYTPDPTARSLRRKKAGAIGVLYTDNLAYAFADPVAVEFLRGVATATEQAGLGLLLLPSSSLENRNPEAVSNALVDGFMVYSMGEDDPLTKAAIQRNLPTVTVDQLRQYNLPFVGIDDEGATRLMAQHLLSLGHTRFGIIMMRLTQTEHNGLVDISRKPVVTHEVIRLRLRGFSSALAFAGINLKDIKVYECFTNTQAKGQEAAKVLLSFDPRPTALLCASDQLAIGAMQAIQEAGLTVPADVSLTGFDDIPAILYTTPALTTVHQPHFEKGLIAGQTLIERLYQQDLAVPPPVILPTHLVIRASTAPPPP